MKKILFTLTITIISVISFTYCKFKLEKWEEERQKRDIEIEYSINHVKDSLEFIKESERVYRIDSLRIFGGYYLGMSLDSFEIITKNILNTTDGIIRIADNDFYISTERCKFTIDNKLYKFIILSKDERTRYERIYPDERFYEDDDERWYFMTKIEKYIEKKYGKPQNSSDYYVIWEYLHKEIRISTLRTSRYESDYDFYQLATEKSALMIEFTSPIMEKEENERIAAIEKAQKEKEEAKQKEEELRKKKIEDSINSVKESFTEGF